MADYNVTVTNSDIKIVSVGTQGDPGVGVPVGGLAGQFLRKLTNNNYEAEWTNSSSTASAIVSDSEPLTGSNGELWFNDSTDVLRVYAGSTWQTQTLDDGFF
jgi:hypothetical protein